MSLYRAAERVSAAVAKGERAAACILIAAVAMLTLLNVFTRYSGYALYWVDEAAIYSMVWATLVATSLSVRQRVLITISLLIDAVGKRVRRVMVIANDLLMLVFGLFMIWLCWRWFDPLALIRADFDVDEFVMATGNFIYGEPTNTLGIRKFWVWLILPVFAVTITIHGVANALASLLGESAARGVAGEAAQ